MEQPTLEDFADRHEPLRGTIDNQVINLLPKVFKSGSKGWFANGKITVHNTRVQYNVILTIIGSKPAELPVQNGTASKTALESPRIDSEPETASRAPKVRRKRS